MYINSARTDGGPCLHSCDPVTHPPINTGENMQCTCNIHPPKNYGGGNIICVVTQEARDPEFQNYKTNPSMRKVNDWRFVVIWWGAQYYATGAQLYAGGAHLRSPPDECGYMMEVHGYMRRSAVIWCNDFSGHYLLPTTHKCSACTSHRPTETRNVEYK